MRQDFSSVCALHKHASGVKRINKSLFMHKHIKVGCKGTEKLRYIKWWLCFCCYLEKKAWKAVKQNTEFFSSQQRNCVTKTCVWFCREKNKKESEHSHRVVKENYHISSSPFHVLISVAEHSNYNVISMCLSDALVLNKSYSDEEPSTPILASHPLEPLTHSLACDFNQLVKENILVFFEIQVSDSTGTNFTKN